jgi:hypothetical protein
MDKKTKMIVCVLLAAVVVLAGFIIYSYSIGWLVSQQQAAYQLGASDAAITIIQKSQDCQHGVTLTTPNNQTFTLIDVRCLQPAGNTTG